MKLTKQAQQISTFFIKIYRSIVALLFLYSIPIAYAGLLIEAFRFFGYLKRFGIDTSIVILASLYLGLSSFFIQDKEKNLKISMLYNLLSLFLAGITFILIILSSSEIYKGIGHIRTEFNLSLSTILAITMYTLFLLFLPLAKRYFQQLPKRHFWKSIALSALITYVMFFRIQTLFDLMLARSSRAFNLIVKTDQERVGSLWSHAAAFLNFVADKTPTDAVILHPIQDYPWPEVGNQYVARRFLYPRTLIAPEWGKGTPTHILVDDGSPNRERYSDRIDRMGWPVHIYPSSDVLLMQPWEKKITVTSVLYGNVSIPLDVQTGAGNYSGDISINPSYDSTEIVASFEKLQYAHISLTKPIPLDEQNSIRIAISSNEGFNVVPVLLIESLPADGSKSSQHYLYFEPNSAEGETLFLLPNPYERLASLLTTSGQELSSNYQVTVLLDVGYPKAMPFLYSKGVLTLPKLGTYNACDTPVVCLYQFEELVYAQKFGEAKKLVPALKAQMPFNGYFNYLTYLTLKELGESEEVYIPYLRAAAKYWSADSSYNLPRILLQDYISNQLEKNQIKNGVEQ